MIATTNNNTEKMRPIIEATKPIPRPGPMYAKAELDISEIINIKIICIKLSIY